MSPKLVGCRLDTVQGWDIAAVDCRKLFDELKIVKICMNQIFMGPLVNRLFFYFYAITFTKLNWKNHYLSLDKSSGYAILVIRELY